MQVYGKTQFYQIVVSGYTRQYWQEHWLRFMMDCTCQKRHRMYALQPRPFFTATGTMGKVSAANRHQMIWQGRIGQKKLVGSLTALSSGARPPLWYATHPIGMQQPWYCLAWPLAKLSPAQETAPGQHTLNFPATHPEANSLHLDCHILGNKDAFTRFDNFPLLNQLNVIDEIAKAALITSLIA